MATTVDLPDRYHDISKPREPLIDGVHLLTVTLLKINIAALTAHAIHAT